MDHCLVVVFGSHADGRVDEQLRELSRDLDGAREREVGFVEVRQTPQPAEFRELAGVEEGEFAVLVFGKDGTEKSRAEGVLPVDELWRRIDE
jgi:hypothetical protein